MMFRKSTQPLCLGLYLDVDQACLSRVELAQEEQATAAEDTAGRSYPINRRNANAGTLQHLVAVFFGELGGDGKTHDFLVAHFFRAPSARPPHFPTHCSIVAIAATRSVSFVLSPGAKRRKRQLAVPLSHCILAVLSQKCLYFKLQFNPFLASLAPYLIRCRKSG